jgi:DNA-binding CsgD family transcriptional regulator
VDPATLRELHRTLARTARSEDVRAHHLGEAASGPDEAAASALDESALQARTRGASLDAVSLYERASLLTPDSEQAIRRAVLAAEGAFIDLADLPYADALLGRAVERAAPGAARAEAMSLRALVWYFQGRQTEATALCEAALAECSGDGAVRAKILLRCAYLHGQVDMRRSMVELTEACDILEHETERVDADLMTEALLDRANGALQMAEGFRADDVERAASLHPESGRSWEWDRCEMILYELARHTDDLEVALTRLDAQIERRANRGVEDSFRFVHAALINCWLGNWATARTWAERAIDVNAREGGELYGAFALRGLAFVEALEGNVEEARRLALEGLQLTTEQGDVVVAILHRGILGFVALSTGDAEEADRQLTEAARLDEQLAVTHPFRSRIDGDRVEAAVGVGDVERAQRIVERLERIGAIAPTPWTLAIGARSRGLLEAARGDLGAAAEALERALEEHERLPMPFERARTLLALGRVRRRLKQKRLARLAFEAALAIFAELGAAVWAERTRQELQRVATRRAPTTLTPTEHEIARLASEGLTNSAIAERVFVSVNTVEANLRRAYRKLGITSRAQLARALDEQARTPIS